MLRLHILGINKEHIEQIKHAALKQLTKAHLNKMKLPINDHNIECSQYVYIHSSSINEMVRCGMIKTLHRRNVDAHVKSLCDGLSKMIEGNV